MLEETPPVARAVREWRKSSPVGQLPSIKPGRLFDIINKNSMREITKELLEEKIRSRKNWIRKAESNIESYRSEIEEFEQQLRRISIEEIEHELFNRDRNE